MILIVGMGQLVRAEQRTANLVVAHDQWRLRREKIITILNMDSKRVKDNKQNDAIMKSYGVEEAE